MANDGQACYAWIKSAIRGLMFTHDCPDDGLLCGTRYILSSFILWLIFTIFFAGTAHLPFFGEVLGDVFLGPEESLLPPVEVSRWHYPSECDAALQRVRPSILKYLVDIVGGCPDTNAAMIVSVPHGFQREYERSLYDAGLPHCSFVIQSRGKQNGLLIPVAFGLEEVRLTKILRQRLVATEESQKMFLSHGLHIFIFPEEDVLTRRDCLFVRSRGGWADVVTFVAFNPQAAGLEFDPLLRKQQSQDESAGHEPHMTKYPRIIAIPHPYEWDTRLPGPITDETRASYFPPDVLIDALDRTDADASRRRSGVISGRRARIRDARNVEKPPMYRVLWRGVTTGAPPFNTSDRHRAIMLLQKEQLRRMLETPQARELMMAEWGRGGGGLHPIPYSAIAAAALPSLPRLQFADACFTRFVQGVTLNELGIVVRPFVPKSIEGQVDRDLTPFERAVSMNENSRELCSSNFGIESSSRMFGSYFVLDEHPAIAHEESSLYGNPSVLINLNGKGACRRMSPSSLLRSGFIHIDVDGNGNAWEGLRWKLCAGSVVIKIASFYDYYQWYYDKLVNGTHLIIVSSDTLERDLIQTVESVAADEALMARLSRGALAFCKQHLGVNIKEEYYERLFDNIP